MTTTHRKKPGTARATPWALAALLTLLPLTGHALGLGKLRVHSALNQPLNAEIEFTSLTEAELKGLGVKLASRADFTAAGVEYATFLAQIKFTVNRRADGRYVLHLSTPTPIEEPFLHALLQVDWAGGRLVREYTALIDPPSQISAKAPVVDPPRAPAAPDLKTEPKPEPVTAPAPGPEPVVPTPVQPATDRIAPAAAAEPYAPPATGDVALSSDGWPLEPGETPPPEAKPAAPKTAAKGRIGPAPSWANTASYTAKRGETLWSITKKVRSDPQVSIEQAALAIYRQNRDAFYGDNLNNIHAGKILHMPTGEEVEALSKEQARGAFQAQFDAWQEYKLRLAKAKRTVAVEDPAEVGAGAPAESKPVADTPATKKQASTAKGGRSDELLKIVRSNIQGEKGTEGAKAGAPAKAGEGEQAALAERAATLEESLASKQIEQKELSEKINQVRSQLKRESRLIELESQSLAPAPKPVDASKPEAPKAAAPVAGPAKTEPPKAVEPPKPEAPQAEAPKPEEKPKAETPKPAPKKVVPPPPPAAEKGFVDTVLGSLGDLFLPIVAGVVGLLIVGLALVYMRRRRKAVAEFEESILASQAVNTENVATRDVTGQATTPESSILSDISQGNMAHVRTDEVDPVAEAEVYLAYGRDETAEDILKDAVVKHPQRQELKIKLLEIYSHRKDIKAFETLAEEVYAATSGKGGKLWEKVEDMGRKLSPNNPMFRGTAPALTPGRAATPDETKATPAPTEVVPPPKVEPTLAPEAALDFDLGTSEVTTDATKDESSFDLDFNLDQVKPAAPEKKPDAAVAAKPPASDFDTGLEPLDFGKPGDSNTVDFDFGKTGTAASTAASTGATKTGVSAATGDDFSLDLGMSAAPAETAAAPVAASASPPPAGGQQQRWDEAATKLDLARAYIDMGDADGARSILDEVLAEGNPEQKKQAQDLVAQIR